MRRHCPCRSSCSGPPLWKNQQPSREIWKNNVYWGPNTFPRHGFGSWKLKLKSIKHSPPILHATHRKLWHWFAGYKEACFPHETNLGTRLFESTFMNDLRFHLVLGHCLPKTWIWQWPLSCLPGNSKLVTNNPSFFWATTWTWGRGSSPSDLKTSKIIVIDIRAPLCD